MLKISHSDRSTPSFSEYICSTIMVDSLVTEEPILKIDCKTPFLKFLSQNFVHLSLSPFPEPYFFTTTLLSALYIMLIYSSYHIVWNCD